VINRRFSQEGRFGPDRATAMRADPNNRRGAAHRLLGPEVERV
jgi:hypothetical protein